MWWIYFHKGAEAGSELISRSSEPGRVARLAYTYLHMPIVAGIILTAVADELVLKHPGGHSDLKTVLSAIGGPLLFLVGTILFKHTIRGFLQLSHGVGIVALGVLAWFAGELSPLMAVDPHHRDHGHGRGVGIAVAARQAPKNRGLPDAKCQRYFWSTTFGRTRSDSRTTSARSLAFSSSSDNGAVSMSASHPHLRRLE